MVNKDTVTKQENKLQSLSKEIKTTDDSIQTEQLLNLQLSNDHNTLMTDLSHILNQRNRLLIECEGLKNTVQLLQNQYKDSSEIIEEEQAIKEEIQQQLQDITIEIEKMKEDYTHLQQDYSKSRLRLRNIQ